LHLAVGNKESQACWTEFFRSLLSRGMRAPTTITSDGAPGLINAITACFPASIRIRCWFHRLGNIRAKLPDETAGEVLAHVYAVRDAPTLDAARVAADRLVNTYRREYPAAIACFTDDLDALLAIHRVPVRHRIRVRTTNLAERSFVEERRRTKVIPRLTDEKAAMKLVFATMIRAADRWCRVSISELERHQFTCCAPNSDSTHTQPIPTTARPTRARTQPHDHQATDLQDAQDLTTYLRMMFLKFRYRLGYKSLCREVSDSIMWRRFCRIPLDGSVPHPTTLMKLTTRCGAAAVAELNEALLAKAAKAKLLRTTRLRADTTVVAANVSYPTDSSLLAKAVRRIAATGRRIRAAGGAGRPASGRTRSPRSLSRSYVGVSPENGL
jgi:mutator family transposase/transposase-like protein DUF772